jgi:hypothetical protein
VLQSKLHCALSPATIEIRSILLTPTFAVTSREPLCTPPRFLAQTPPIQSTSLELRVPQKLELLIKLSHSTDTVSVSGCPKFPARSVAPEKRTAPLQARCDLGLIASDADPRALSKVARPFISPPPNPSSRNCSTHSPLLRRRTRFNPNQ